MSPGILHNTQISVLSVYRLFLSTMQSQDWWEPCTLGLWPCRARGLWQITTAELATNRRISSLSGASPSSFENVKEKWVPEVTRHCPKTPFLLVGTQIDLRDDPSTTEKLAKNTQKPVPAETAEKLARGLRPSRSGAPRPHTQGLGGVFDGAVWAALEPPDRRRAAAVRCCAHLSGALSAQLASASY